MPPYRQVLFVQGGGAGTHDEWDNTLADSLRNELGNRFDVRCPRMPHEDRPSYLRWSAAIKREMADPHDGAVVVGHSAGGAILIDAPAAETYRVRASRRSCSSPPRL